MPTPEMTYRKVPRLGAAVSELGLGTAQLGNTDGRQPGMRYVPAEDVLRILAVMLDAGVTFFDTADFYGNAEIELGRLPAATKARVMIATKAGRTADGRRDFSPSYLEGQVERSLRRLRVDALDLFQLNKPSVAQLATGEPFDVLDRLKRAGKIRFAGVVVGDLATGDPCVRAGVVDAIQVLYNMLVTEAEGVIRAAAGDGLLVVARSPLNSGVLSGTYTPATTFPLEDERSGYFAGDAFVARVRAVEAMQVDLGAGGGRLLEMALAFVLSNPDVSTVIPGASSVAQARRYLACAHAPCLNADERARIARVVEHHLRGVPRVFQN